METRISKIHVILRLNIHKSLKAIFFQLNFPMDKEQTFFPNLLPK